jgi:hypothetical protein
VRKSGELYPPRGNVKDVWCDGPGTGACTGAIGCGRLVRTDGRGRGGPVDPVTLVVTAVALGASAGVTETASSAIKDAYAGLKGLLSKRQVDLSGIERRPDSTTQRDALCETLTDRPDVVDQEVLDAAEQVAATVAAHRPGAADVIGVDLTDVQAAFVRVRSISSSGSGFRGTNVTVSGGIDIGDVRAGSRQGNTDPPER